MKGYREFSPIAVPPAPTVSEPVENEDGNFEWQERSIYEEQGFRPY